MKFARLLKMSKGTSQYTESAVMRHTHCVQIHFDDKLWQRNFKDICFDDDTRQTEYLLIHVIIVEGSYIFFSVLVHRHFTVQDNDTFETKITMRV